MTGYQRICCPIDFSESSRKAMEEGARMARHYGAGFTVLHIQEAAPPGVALPFAPPPHGSAPDAAGELNAWRAHAESIAGSTVGSVMLGAPVAPAIVGFARDTGTDLIVMGSHGRTGFRRVVLGSVAEAVMRSAPCPVLVVPSPEPVRPDEAGGTTGMPA
jgi:nucleotide-binding universal stress UspA family protein